VHAQVQAPAAPGATAEVRDTAGRLLATADFREGRGEVLVTVSFPNPPVLSGTHALHITDTGRCDPPDFATSGNIFNPNNKKHGRQNPEGSEVGDLPNVNFSTGLTSYNTTAVGATLGQGAASLLSPNRALVIYSGEDDQKTDPDGNPGTKIGCGVISASSGAAPAVAAPAPAAPAAAPAVAVASPTPTPQAASSAVRIASPVVAQPAAQQPQPPAAQQPQQPAVQQPQPGQPAVKPASSPVVVRPAVVVNNSSASPTPVTAAAAVPTPIGVATPPVAVAAAQSAQSGGGLNTASALIIAILGAGLIVVGYLLRQRRVARKS
jgi:Cu-Zn family superoxide dismutase